MFTLTHGYLVAIVIILLVQIIFIVAVYGLIILKKFQIWKQDQHYDKSLMDLNERLSNREISEQQYRNCKFDLEQLYRSYFEKWK